VCLTEKPILEYYLNIPECWRNKPLKTNVSYIYLS